MLVVRNGFVHPITGPPAFQQAPGSEEQQQQQLKTSAWSRTDLINRVERSQKSIAITPSSRHARTTRCHLVRGQGGCHPNHAVPCNQPQQLLLAPALSACRPCRDDDIPACEMGSSTPRASSGRPGGSVSVRDAAPRSRKAAAWCKHTHRAGAHNQLSC